MNQNIKKRIAKEVLLLLGVIITCSVLYLSPSGINFLRDLSKRNGIEAMQEMEQSYSEYNFPVQIQAERFLLQLKSESTDKWKNRNIDSLYQIFKHKVPKEDYDWVYLEFEAGLRQNARIYSTKQFNDFIHAFFLTHEYTQSKNDNAGLLTEYKSNLSKKEEFKRVKRNTREILQLYLTSLLLIIIYPARWLFQLVRWAIKTVKS